MMSLTFTRTDSGRLAHTSGSLSPRTRRVWIDIPEAPAMLARLAVYEVADAMALLAGEGPFRYSTYVVHPAVVGEEPTEEQRRVLADKLRAAREARAAKRKAERESEAADDAAAARENAERLGVAV